MTRKKQIIYAVGAVGVLVVLLAIVKTVQISIAISQGKKNRPPPSAVTTFKATAVEWNEILSAMGSLVPTQGVTLSAEVAGRVSKINFESGDTVAAGAVLVELDTAVEEANLRGAEALAAQSEKALIRAKALRDKNANSLADLESAQASAREAEAAVESLRATIERKRIVAPFSGRTGIRAVNLGQYLSPGTAVVPIHVLDPLFVNFTLPQQAISSIASGQEVRIKVDAFPSETFAGAISTINPNVDLTTRNVEIQAAIPNSGERLRPGMFASVEVILPMTEKYVAIPSSSINYAPYGDSVYVIDTITTEDGTSVPGVKQQNVKLGATRGELVAIISGLNPGDEVVSSGVFRLRPGLPVTINNDFSIGASENPQPEDT